MNKMKFSSFQKRLLLLIFILVSLIFSVGVTIFSKYKICTHIDIAIKAEEMKELINDKIIQERIIDWFPQGLVGLPKNKIDLDDLERKIESLKTVKNAEVSLGIEGVLSIKIIQNIPILLMQNNSGERHYLLEDSSIVSATHTLNASVPTYIGGANQAMIKKLYTFAKYVNENPFANSFTQQIFVTSQKEIAIIPNVGEFKVIFGDINNLEKKFENIKNFIKHGLPHIGWQRYKIIDVQYSNQVICK